MGLFTRGDTKLVALADRYPPGGTADVTAARDARHRPGGGPLGSPGRR
ncbi:hypothetical protein ACFW4M_05380 [Streptomyces sp. NPDC058794]